MVSRPLSIVYLSPGAGGMFCGSCLNDNMLAAAMSHQGHSVCLVPIYTPTRTDESNQSIDKLFFGGVNVYLQQKSPIFRLLPRFVDRVLDRPSLVQKLAGNAIGLQPDQLGELTLSMVRGEEGNQRKEIRRLVDWLSGQPRPDIVALSNLLIAGCVPALHRELNAPIVVTLQGDDLFLDDLPEPHRSQVLSELRKLTRSVDRFLVHSRFYADWMSDLLEIDPSKIDIVPLGLSLEGFADTPRRYENQRPPTVGYLARICPAKGFHLLIEAFMQLKQREDMSDVRLHAAGWLGESDRSYFQQQIERLREANLFDVFHYAGVVDRPEKIDFLQSLDVLSVPTTYREPKGRYVLEALASGVPVVQPNHGTFPELLTETGGGRLVSPNDPAELARALGDLLSDRTACRQLGEEGRIAVRSLHAADVAAEKSVAVFQSCLAAS